MQKRKMEGRKVRLKANGREGYVLSVLKSNTGKKMKTNGQKGNWLYLIAFNKTFSCNADELIKSELIKREAFDYLPEAWEFDE